MLRVLGVLVVAVVTLVPSMARAAVQVADYNFEAPNNTSPYGSSGSSHGLVLSGLTPSGIAGQAVSTNTGGLGTGNHTLYLPYSGVTTVSNSPNPFAPDANGLPVGINSYLGFDVDNGIHTSFDLDSMTFNIGRLGGGTSDSNFRYQLFASTTNATTGFSGVDLPQNITQFGTLSLVSIDLTGFTNLSNI